MSSEIVVDISSWRMRDHEDWTRAIYEDKNVGSMIDMMAEVVVSWPFEGDPADIEAYRELAPLEWLEVVKEVGNAIEAAFQRPGDKLDQSRKVRKSRHNPR
jgi:hypothetical protein